MDVICAICIFVHSTYGYDMCYVHLFAFLPIYYTIYMYHMQYITLGLSGAAVRQF